MSEENDTLRPVDRALAGEQVVFPMPQSEQPNQTHGFEAPNEIGDPPPQPVLETDDTVLTEATESSDEEIDSSRHKRHLFRRKA